MRAAMAGVFVLGVSAASYAKPGGHEHHSNEHSEHFYRMFHETARHVHDGLSNLQALPMLIRTMGANEQALSGKHRMQTRTMQNGDSDGTKNDEYRVTKEQVIHYLRSQVVPHLNDYNGDLVMFDQRRQEPPTESTDYVLKLIPIAYHLGKELNWTFPRDLQTLIEGNYHENYRIDDEARTAAAAKVKEALDKILKE